MPPNIFSTILNPKSIAVVGASRSPQKVGYQILKNILDGGYAGKVYPINPNAKEILGKKVYPLLSHLPRKPDLVVVVTPAPLVLPIIEEADQLGIRAAIVITAGFAENGIKGQELQHRLTEFVHGHRIRVLGPNCLGCFSTRYRVNATFGPPLPNPGKVLLISQSGALVTGVLDWARKHHLGLSHAITLGNRLDISEIEALDYALQDKHTDIVMMYLESFSHAETFFSLASLITPHKPVLLLKGGQSAAGQSASASHTAALATNYTLVRAFARQTGLVLVDSIEQWLVSAHLFAATPLPQGNQIAIITNAGGPGVLATDGAVNHHLAVTPFTGKTCRQLEQGLHLAKAQNPLDLLGDATPEEFVYAVKSTSLDPRVDFLLIIITPQTTTKPVTTATLLANLLPHLKKPVYTVLLGGQRMLPAQRILEKARVPVFTYPNEAIDAIATLNWYARHRRGFYFYPARPGSLVSRQRQKILHRQLAAGVTLPAAFSLLQTYGFHLPKHRIIQNLTDLPDALADVGRPAVIKTAGMHLAHKAKHGGVALGLMTVPHARLAFRKMQRLAQDVLVQQTIHGQVEIIIGAKRDPQLGTFITIGLGGSLTDSIADRAYAFIPAQGNYLKYTLSQTKAYTLMRHQSLPAEPVIDALQKMSGIMLDFPEIAEMEINPAIITPYALYACDIKITPLE